MRPNGLRHLPGTGDERAVLMRRVASRLATFGTLGAGDVSVLERLEGEVERHPRGAEMTPRADGAPRLVIAGWACHMRPDAARRRQIFGFLLPGDVIGSVWGPADFTFYNTTALTVTLTLGLAELVAMGGSRPQVLRAAGRAESHAQHRLFDHLVRLGARDAYAGLGHLLLELHGRLHGMGLADDDAFVLPVGQRVLAQAMGFSLVHTNQTLKRMCADGMLALQGERVRLLQRGRMAALCQYTDAGPQEREGSAMHGLHDQP